MCSTPHPVQNTCVSTPSPVKSTTTTSPRGVRTKLPDLLRFAGADELATQIDPHIITTVLNEVETHLRSRDLQLDTVEAQ